MTQRAYTPAGFCAAYGIGKTTFYAEVKAGYLPIRKVGRRTLILIADAERWERNLVGKFMGRNKAGLPGSKNGNEINGKNEDLGGRGVCRNDDRRRSPTTIFLAVSNA